MAGVLPSMELGALRAAFNGGAANAAEPLNADSLTKLSYIMGRQYDRPETNFIRRLGLANASCGATYSGFDMGGGESSVIFLLPCLYFSPALVIG